MKNKELAKVLESVSVEELKALIPLKQKLDALEGKKKALQKDLVAIVKQIDTLQSSLGQGAAKKGPAPKKKAVRKKARTKAKGKAKKKAAKKTVKKKARKKTAQPSIAALIVEILKEKKRPVSVNEICDILIKEKKYKTQSKRFGNQIRVLLYRNEKGLFKKAGPGRFKLAGK